MMMDEEQIIRLIMLFSIIGGCLTYAIVSPTALSLREVFKKRKKIKKLEERSTCEKFYRGFEK